MKLELIHPGGQASGRRLRRIKADSKLVFLHASSDKPEKCELLDESFGGIGVRFHSHVPFQTGQELEVSYNGVEMCAVVRHVTTSHTGTRVGFEWKAAGVSREVREAVASHAGDDDVFQFLVALPSGFYMMWKLFESEKWFELKETADRLLRLAKRCKVTTLKEHVEALQSAIDLPEPREPTRKALDVLMEKCVACIG
jgi:hypothetical protein